MAQLKDLVVNGASRFIGDIFGNKAQLTTLEAPISAGDSEYGPGTNGQVLKSNGNSLYWGTGGGGEYLTCSTAAGTAAKVITKDGFALTAGASVFVVFSNTNTANNPTLNINLTGAKAIYYNGARVIYQGLAKDIIYHLVYDGTQWQVINTIKPEIGICSTADTSAGKTATCPGFTLFNGAIAHIIFSKQNSHATPTLNINSTGAKAINCAGATTENKFRFGGSDHVYTLMYDGTKYNILQEDIRHLVSRGKSAVLYTQEEYDAYIAENGENPTWNVGDVKTAAVEGVEQIAIGNYTTSNTDNGMTGKLLLCSEGTTYTRILAQSGYSKNFYLPKYNGDMYAVHVGDNNAVGTATEPVYIAANGRAAKGDKYAGGTAVTLNNTSKAKTTASFYAPTAGGANNTQALVGAGTTTAPKWVNISTTLATSTAATDSAGQKLKVTVLGQASSEVELSKATNALYGVTKLTDSYSSTDGTMATTGKALLAALQTLDVDAVGVAAATGNKFISQISETDGKISAAVSTATLGSTSLPVWVDGGVIKTITSYEGTAAKATADANGNNIADTYLTKAAGVTDVTLNASSQKLQKIINSTTSDIMYMPFVPGTGTNSAIGGYIPTSTSEDEEAKRPKATGQYAIAYGPNASASGKWSIAIGDTAIVEKPTGAQTNPNYAVAIGNESKATALNAIAIGGRNSDVGPCFAGGAASVALGAGAKIVQDAHYGISIGYGSQVSSAGGIAIGRKTESKGNAALAFGNTTIATGKGSFVAGRFNIEDTTATSENLDGTYALIIGNGSEGARSNALTVNWTGNVETAGSLFPMTTDTLDIGSSTQKWNNVYAANFNGAKIFYGTCATAAGTAQKDVVCDSYTNTGDPVKGDIVFVTFDTTNSAAVANLLLKVGNSTAKSLRCLRNGAVNNLPAVDYIRTNETYCFCYNGTAWVTVVDYNSNTNTLMRTYASSTNVELPLLAGSTANSATAVAPTHTSSYKDLYGALPATIANRSTINPSTGAITFNGKLILKSGVTYGDTLPTSGATTGQIFFTPAANSNITQTEDKIYMVGVKAATDPTLYYNSNVYAENNVLFGAAWNDYAEYRESLELEPGRVVIELGNGRLVRSSERLQPGAEIVSDTYGFIIGKGNPRCATPIAIAGRVLAYPYEERLMFFAGDAVCAGPDGTVSKMTREEIKEYPDRIIGTVSEVPEYETWGENNIKVNGRIWIRLR